MSSVPGRRLLIRLWPNEKTVVYWKKLLLGREGSKSRCLEISSLYDMFHRILNQVVKNI